MKQTLKTQLEGLKKGCRIYLTGVSEQGYQWSDECGCCNHYCPICQAKISLLSQIISDLKQEWQNWDKTTRTEVKEFIEQIIGISSEELSQSSEEQTGDNKHTTSDLASATSKHRTTSECSKVGVAHASDGTLICKNCGKRLNEIRDLIK